MFHSLIYLSMQSPDLGMRSLPKPLKVTVEQPSPVSVLDVAFDEDESPSPVRKISVVFKGESMGRFKKFQTGINFSSSLEKKC